MFRPRWQPNAPPRLLARVRARAAGERGLTLLEVVVSAAILATIVVGTFTAFDAAGRLTTNEQQRSQANDLAQQDQDRLRGMQISQLSSLNQTRNVTLNGTTFSVVSTGQFEADTTGTSSCATNSSADYIKTTSTVTWPTIGTRPAVVAESIITPPAGGSLIVQAVNANGAGVPNMAVSGTGPSTFSATSGPDGCAILGGLAGGTYNVTVSRAGFVDKDGNSSPPVSQQPITVIVGSSATKTFFFDQAGSISTTFDTRKYGAPATSVSADTVTLFNNNMTFPGFRSAGTLGTLVPAVTASNLFPFTSPYTVYAGSCSADAPSANGQGAGSDPSLVVGPGQTASLLLHLPALNLTVWSGTSSLVPGSVVSNAHVVLTDQGCGGSPPTAGGSPPIERTLSTNPSGQLNNPGQPFGTFKVCADARVTGIRRSASTVVANNQLSGTTVNLYLGAGAGQCT
jgi:Tfp pilus assembly protein PilV